MKPWLYRSKLEGYTFYFWCPPISGGGSEVADKISFVLPTFSGGVWYYFFWLLRHVRPGHLLGDSVIEGTFEADCLQLHWRGFQSCWKILLVVPARAGLNIFFCLVYINHVNGLYSCRRVDIFLHPRLAGSCYRGVSEVLGRTALLLQVVSPEDLSQPSFLVVHWRRRSWRFASLLSEGVFRVAVFPCFLWGGEDKKEVIEDLVSSALRGFITGWPCHVVTLQIAVRVSYGYYFIKSCRRSLRSD